MKNRVIYIDNAIYVYIAKKLNKKEKLRLKNKIDFIKSSYGVNNLIIISGTL